MGLPSCLRPKTTSEAKAQGRSKKETTAPPTVCRSGAPYMEGVSQSGRFSAGRRGATRAASVRSSASLLLTVWLSR